MQLHRSCTAVAAPLPILANLCKRLQCNLVTEIWINCTPAHCNCTAVAKDALQLECSCTAVALQLQPSCKLLQAFAKVCKMLQLTCNCSATAVQLHSICSRSVRSDQLHRVPCSFTAVATDALQLKCSCTAVALQLQLSCKPWQAFASACKSLQEVATELQPQCNCSAAAFHLQWIGQVGSVAQSVLQLHCRCNRCTAAGMQFIPCRALPES